MLKPDTMINKVIIQVTLLNQNLEKLDIMISQENIKDIQNNEKTRNLMPVSYSKNIDELIKLFSSAEEKRKLVGDEII